MLKIHDGTDAEIECFGESGPVHMLSNMFDCHGLTIVTVEVGGGGDCFFRSVAYLLNKAKIAGAKKLDYRDVRSIAAGAIDENNVDLFLMDMAGICVEKSDGEMVPNEGRKPDQPGSFDPIKHWNDTRGNKATRTFGVKQSIAMPGQHFWGDMVTASLLETVLPVNIVCISAKGESIGASKAELGHMKDLTKVIGTNPRHLPTILLYNVGNCHWRPAVVICRLIKSGILIGHRQCFSVPADKFDILESLF